MANIDRVRVSLTGLAGLPGVATFYGLVGPSAFPVVHDLWNSIIAQFPGPMTATVEPAGDTIDDTTGRIVGSWSIAPAAALQATAVGPYAAPAGGMINWKTEDIRDGHRLKGRTFLVPLLGGIFDNVGTLIPQNLGTLQAAATAFVVSSAGNMVVWHRPKYGPKPAAGGPRPLIRPGAHGIITGSSVQDKVFVLRSRRD